MGFHSRLPGTLLDPGAPINQGLVGWWPMWEGAGGKTLDISGRNHNGTLISEPLWDGGALRFNGTTQRVDINSFTLGSTGDRTFLAEINPTSTTGYIGVVGVANQQLGIVDGRIWIRFDGSGHANSDKTSAVVITTNKWQQIAGVQRGDSVEFYRNGAFLSSTGNVAPINDLSAATIRISNYSATAGWFPGSIRAPRVFNRALSALEVQQLYVSPNFGLWVPDIKRYYIPTAPPVPPEIYYNPMLASVGRMMNR